MVFSVKKIEDPEFDSFVNKCIEELNPFFGIKWTFNKPSVFIVPNRTIINELKGEETKDWLVGWSQGKDLFLLDKENFETESRHKYSEEEYGLLVKHELIHCFCNILFPGFSKPWWLREGLAIYLSGQLEKRIRPEKMKKCLSYFEEGGSGLYSESGFIVKDLIEKHGKEKILELVRKSRKIKNKEEFDELFEQIYGFELGYDIFNT
jgi:hypothetical protein